MLMAGVSNLTKIRPVTVFTQLSRWNFSLSGITCIYKKKQTKMVDAIYGFEYRSFTGAPVTQTETH